MRRAAKRCVGEFRDLNTCCRERNRRTAAIVIGSRRNEVIYNSRERMGLGRLLPDHLILLEGVHQLSRVQKRHSRPGRKLAVGKCSEFSGFAKMFPGVTKFKHKTTPHPLQSVRAGSSGGEDGVAVMSQTACSTRVVQMYQTQFVPSTNDDSGSPVGLKLGAFA